MAERPDPAPRPAAGAGPTGASAADLRRLAHDVRNALNSVAVNLEVARVRAARAGTDPAALVPFLETAARQLDAAARLHKQYTDLVTAVTTGG